MKKRFLSKLIIVILLFNAIALSLLVPVPALALSAGGINTTIASIIISLMLECGVAPVNQTWLNTLNASYGVESSIGTIQDCITSGLLTQSGNTLIDTGLSAAIESQSAYTELGLSQIFTTTADDVAQGVVAGSGGVNLANVAINCGTVGTIGAYAGAAAIGIGLGVLGSHLVSEFWNNIKYGIPVSYSKIMTENALGGELYCSQNPTDSQLQYWNISLANGVKGFGHIYYNTDDGQYHYCVTNVTPLTFGNGLSRAYNINRQMTQNRDLRVYTNGRFMYYPLNVLDKNNNLIYIGEMSSNEYTDYINKVVSGEIEIDNEKHSPDIIGPYGNRNEEQEYDKTVPDGYDMTPVDMNDYQNYADSANNNTEDGNIGEPVQGEQFDDLIDSLLVEPSIIPDQGVTDPEVPDRPIIPDQPTVPGKDPITGEQQSDVLEGVTTPDLRAVFPFCIPFDLYNIFGVLKYEGREAPVIVWEFQILGNSYPVIVDLSPYDDVAALLRLLELLAFIVGLAVATRKLIGAGG